MNSGYTDEKNHLILLSLLKRHGIKRVIASPGTTNISFSRSMQNDAFFEMYSAVDERSAAYMACGLAAETGEPVVLTCTGATASRNYLSGLTEAYYRKLPVLAVTSTQDVAKVGQHIAQIIDRSVLPKDVARHSVLLPTVKDQDDQWACELKANQAILELFRQGGGPVHINLATNYSRVFDVRELPRVRSIQRITRSDNFPALPNGKIGILAGSHLRFTDSLHEAIERFCAVNNAVVFCDHTSAYKGKYRVQHALVSSQRLADKNEHQTDLLIHIGEITGDYSVSTLVGKSIWRVNADGEIRDTFRKCQYVFEMDEEAFFTAYSNGGYADDSYLEKWKRLLAGTRNRIPELPFSNIWVAQQLHARIPENSTIHFGILNSLRSWNFFEVSDSIESWSNVGGFGIDGDVSALLGASLADRNKLYFGVVGDLAFFYDLNSLGNRHLGNNIRILLINNGTGTEFRNFNHTGALFEESANAFIAGGGHFGNKSRTLVKNYSESLGFEYMSASGKEEFAAICDGFVTERMLDKPLVFEVFTDSHEESKALEILTSIETTGVNLTKSTLRNVIGENNMRNLRKILRR